MKFGGLLLNKLVVQSDYWTTKFVKELILNAETDNRVSLQR